jgi:hypothetical protein
MSISGAVMRPVGITELVKPFTYKLVEEDEEDEDADEDGQER